MELEGTPRVLNSASAGGSGLWVLSSRPGSRSLPCYWPLITGAQMALEGLDGPGRWGSRGHFGNSRQALTWVAFFGETWLGRFLWSRRKIQIGNKVEQNTHTQTQIQTQTRTQTQTQTQTHTHTQTHVVFLLLSLEHHPTEGTLRNRHIHLCGVSRFQADFFSGQGALASKCLDSEATRSTSLQSAKLTKFVNRQNQGCGITSVMQGSPRFTWGFRLWEALCVVSQKWSFPTILGMASPCFPRKSNEDWSLAAGDVLPFPAQLI